jgi:WD40 repeat protein
VAFSPNGKLIASGLEGCIIRIWDAVTGICLVESPYDGHQSFAVSSVTFAPNSTLVAYGYDNGTIGLWDIVRGHSSIICKDGPPVLSVNFFPDGIQLMSQSCGYNACPSSCETKVWDIIQCHCISVFQGLAFIQRHIFHNTGHAYQYSHTTQPVTHSSIIALSSNGAYVAFGDIQGGSSVTIRLNDGASFPLLCTLMESQFPLKVIMFSPNGTRIAACPHDPFSIELWDAIGGSKLNTLVGHRGVVTSIQFSANGARIASSSMDGTIRLWDTSATSSAEAMTNWDIPSSILFFPNFTISSVDYRTSQPVPGGMWNANTRHLIHDALYDNPDGRGHHFLSISPCGTHIAQYYPRYCEIGVLDSITGRQCSKLKASFKDMTVNHMVHCPFGGIAFSHDCKTIAITSSILDSQLDTSPADNHVISRSESRIELWSAETGDKLQTLSSDTLSSHWLKYDHITFSHSGTVIAYMENCLAPHRHRLSLCNVNHGRRTWVIDFEDRTLDRPIFPRYCCAQVLFSPDDTLVAVGCFGTGVIRLYNTNCGRSIASFVARVAASHVQDLPPMPLKFFASDPYGAAIISLAGVHYIPQESLSPATISAIYLDSEHFYHIRDDGWVFDGVRRVCWLPLNCRPVEELQASQGCKLAIGTKTKGIVILDFSH